MARVAKSLSGPADSSEYSHARDFMETLLASSTPRGCTTIQNVWAVCFKMIEARETITVAEVGRRLMKQYGGPTTQGIRDQPDRLKRLVALCAEVGRASPSERHVVGSELLKTVPDQEARSRLRLIVEEHDYLKKELAALRRAFTRLAPLQLLDDTLCHGTVSPVAPVEVLSDELSQEERATIRRFLDPAFQHDEGFILDERQGWSSGETGRSILPPAFARALRKTAEGGRTQRIETFSGRAEAPNKEVHDALIVNRPSEHSPNLDVTQKRT